MTWNRAQKLIQNTAQGAKEIQNMHVSLRPQVTHQGPNILLKEFKRKRIQEMTEKQYLKRKQRCLPEVEVDLSPEASP